MNYMLWVRRVVGWSMLLVCVALALVGLWRLLWRWQFVGGLEDLALAFCLYCLILLRMEPVPRPWF